MEVVFDDVNSFVDLEEGEEFMIDDILYMKITDLHWDAVHLSGPHKGACRDVDSGQVVVRIASAVVSVVRG